MRRRLPADGGESGAVEKQASFVRLARSTDGREAAVAWPLACRFVTRGRLLARRRARRRALTRLDRV